MRTTLLTTLMQTDRKPRSRPTNCEASWRLCLRLPKTLASWWNGSSDGYVSRRAAGEGFPGYRAQNWDWFDARLQSCAGVERPNPTSLSVNTESETILPVSQPEGQATPTLLLVIRLGRTWGFDYRPWSLESTSQPRARVPVDPHSRRFLHGVKPDNAPYYMMGGMRTAMDIKELGRDARCRYLLLEAQHCGDDKQTE